MISSGTKTTKIVMILFLTVEVGGLASHYFILLHISNSISWLVAFLITCIFPHQTDNLNGIHVSCFADCASSERLMYVHFSLSVHWAYSSLFANSLYLISRDLLKVAVRWRRTDQIIKFSLREKLLDTD